MGRPFERLIQTALSKESEAVLVVPKLERVSKLLAEGQIPVSEIAKIAGVDRTTLHRHLRPDETPQKPK